MTTRNEREKLFEAGYREGLERSARECQRIAQNNRAHPDVAAACMQCARTILGLARESRRIWEEKA